MKIGQILLQQRRIDRDQLREALRRQRRTGRPLGEIFLGMGVVSRDEVIDALLRQPTAAADAETLAKVKPVVARTIRREDAENWDCLLLVRRKEWACVAMVDPLDHKTRRKIEEHLGVAVIAVASRPGELSEARDRIYDPVDAAA